MVPVNSDGSRQCLSCGQEFHPARVSLAQVEAMTERLASATATAERQVRTDFENRADLRLWVPKNYQ